MQPKQTIVFRTCCKFTEVVYDAATDGKEQLRYIAGADAKAIYAMRSQVGDEAFRKAIKQKFLGQ